VTKKLLLCHFLSGLTADVSVGVATFIVAHPTSYASSAFQADFAANCKIWVK
jgi:hypothetical protein